METTPTDLETVRARIDAVDAELLRLLAERAGLAADVLAAKRAAAGGGPLGFGLRPAREAQLLRGLIARARGSALRPELLVRIWREIMGDSLKRQGPFAIALYGGRAPARMVELARSRFGAAPELILHPTPEAALKAARPPGVVAVLPLESGAAGWGRLLAEPGLAAFALLPCFAGQGAPQALAAAAVTPEPSGWDQTLWATDAGGPAEDLERRLGDCGLVGDLLSDEGGLRLYALAGFLQSDDQRLALAPGRLKGVLGSAPLPMDL